ncbi:hypothetical protein F0562_018000 [Nyssa sinensis]|uniref:Uncharacterized protein n=1 Tax=Nyssa sinensis TaxID=561372 RepID=A0A5J4ZC47_9ASTE|nr:hypothetical protein F0562_018000 [Nyssa sinensis]
MFKAEEQKKVAEMNRKKAMDEKSHADYLSRQLEEHRRRIEKLQKKMDELVSSRNLVKSPAHPPDKQMNADTMEMKAGLRLDILKREADESKLVLEYLKSEEASKRLEEEKQKVIREKKHADAEMRKVEGQRKVAEVNRKKALEEKHQADQLARQLEAMKAGTFSYMQSINLKGGLFAVEPCKMKLHGENDLVKPICTSVDAFDFFKQYEECPASLLPISEGNCTECISVVAENSVKSPISIDAVARRAGHSKKRKRILDAVESIEHLYSEGKKWHMQIEEKLSMLQEANVCTQSNPATNKLTEIAQPCKDGLVDYVRNSREILGSFENVVDGDYMKFFDLDNAVDEERYCAAIEMPVSPSLPEIEFQSCETFEIDNSKQLVDESSYKGLSSEKDNLMLSCIFDVINVDIDSNNFECNDSRTSCTPFLHRNEGFIDSFEKTDVENGALNTVCLGNASVHQNCDSGAELGVSDGSISGNEDGRQHFLDILCYQSLEKVCVFFSVVLHNFSGIALRNLANYFLDSFAGHICAVMSVVETRSMFSELCHLDELLTLIEDFLIDRRVLVYNDVSSESSPVCDSRVKIFLNGVDIILSFETALTHQLVAAGIVLASICAAVDHIGFICEASYNIVRPQKFDSSLMLTILHVFVYLCGSKYFTQNNYCLLMNVLKSLVMFLERENLLTDSAPSLPFPAEDWPEFPSCIKCAFSEGAVSMDIVILLLLEKLQNCAFSANMHQDLMESTIHSILEPCLKRRKLNKIQIVEDFVMAYL